VHRPPVTISAPPARPATRAGAALTALAVTVLWSSSWVLIRIGLDDEALEPPVPPGLGQLSASLETLATFLRISDDLLAVAAPASPDLPQAPAPGDLKEWITSLPAAEKEALLLRFAGEPAHAHAELLQRFRQTNAPRSAARAGERTVAMLLAAAEERQAAERARREQEEAGARARYLDSLGGREEALWRQVDALVEMKNAKAYDQAVQLLTDLHELSGRHQRGDAFAARLDALLERYAKRPSLLERLDRAGLRA